MDDRNLDDARKRYHFALAPEDYERLPFYSALLRQLEDDSTALELLASVRVEQRNPMLVLAALHYRALCGHDVLTPIYESAREGRVEDPDAAATDVLSVLRSHPELVSSELWRSTQTNEPGRSAVLQAVVGDIAGNEEVIDIIEVGTSAGINLNFDAFVVRAKDDGHPLTLVCDDRSTSERSMVLPRIGKRIGIDPHPLDLNNDDDRRWLKACLWPEEHRRHERFDAIIEQQPLWPSREILTGTALERLDDALAKTSSDHLVVLFNTWVLFYFSKEDRARYIDAMTKRCAANNLAWISIESTLIPFPGVEVHPDAHHRGASQIIVTRPGGSPTLWGWCHPHGRWIERPSPSEFDL